MRQPTDKSFQLRKDIPIDFLQQIEQLLENHLKQKKKKFSTGFFFWCVSILNLLKSVENSLSLALELLQNESAIIIGV